MFKNYFKTAYRNIIKNKTNSFISIFGLAIGMAVCIMLLLYVKHELSYDRYHQNADHIYRLCNPEHPAHAPQVAKLIAENFPEVKNYARIKAFNQSVFQYKQKKFFETEFAYVDPSLFQMFSFKFKQGNPETVLQKPFTMVISEKAAKKYFGNEDPVGKVLTHEKTLNFTITGIIEDIPENSHFKFDFFLTLAGAESEKMFGKRMMNHWGWINFLVYFQVQDNFSKTKFEVESSQLILKHRKTGQYDDPDPKYTLQNLKDIHLYSSHFKGDIQPQNSITYVLVFSAIGILILLIACFNYVNLLTSTAISRAKEIGIKKSLGASRNNLAVQFISESIVVLFMALILSLFIVVIFLPVFNNLSGKALTPASLFNIMTILSILGVAVITSILASSYPAFYLAAIKPVTALKPSSTDNKKSSFHFRNILVGVQFTIVIALLCSAFVMFQQINFLQNKKLGFNKESVLVADAPSFGDINKYRALKQSLLQQNNIISVSAASRVPSGSLGNIGTILPEGQSKPIAIPYVHITHDYFKTLGIDALKGRLFSQKVKTDEDEAVILNMEAVKKLGIYDNPIGKSVKCSWPKSNRKIIGVIENFHFESMYDPIKPIVFVFDNKQCYQLMVKVQSSGIRETINTMQNICKDFYPEGVFEFHFLDERLENIYQKDKKTFTLLGYFTFIAIFIALMGLFGQASFMMKRRIKEIAVRKVLGASITQILILLNKNINRWLLIANIIAWPLAYYFMNIWLQNFAYRVNLTVFPFILAGISSMAISIITVLGHTLNVAKTNPVDSLRRNG